jgi:hypothetical protein
MTFLAPAALLGALLLAIPVLVHLFRPRKMRQTPFSSLRWLKETQQRLSRRVQWHRWLLFLLRAGCILLLVVALARPIAGLGEAGRPAARVVIVDVGRAMAYQPPGLPTPLDRARELAADVVARARPGDRTALVLAGARPRLLTPLVADPAVRLPDLQAARPEAAEADLGRALALTRSLVGQGGDGRDVELVFLTANRRRSWHQADVQQFVKALPQPPRVEVVDLGPGAVQNAWIAGARLLAPDEADYRLLRVEVGCVGDSRQERGVRLAGISGLGEDVQPVSLSPGRTARVAFKVPAAVPLAGQVAELRLEPADALPGDDQFFLNLDARWALHVLLVEPEAPGPDGRGAGLYVRAAVQALAEAGNHSLELVSRPARAVSPGDFQKADVVVLAGVPRLTDAALEGLEARVRAGAGLVVFLGPGMDEGFYNRKLFRALQPAEGLLPVPLVPGRDLVTTSSLGLLTGVRWSHPLLAPLRDPLFGDLTLCRFRRHAAFAAAPGPGDAVLARIDGAAPALVERPLGAGRVLVWNTTADDAWGDLPRRRSFVPLLDRMLSYLTAGGVRRSFTAGESVTLPLPDGRPDEEVTVTTPAGAKLVPRLQGQGGKLFLHLNEASEPGVYRVERQGKAGLAFAVNAPRDGSPLAPMDGTALEQWWSPASVEVLGADAARERFASGSGTWPLWPTLIFLGCLLLLAETVYVHRLCPRLNPAVAESVVPQRGLLRPLSEKTI